MSTVEELFAEAGYEEVNDVILIDPVTRQLQVPDTEIILGVETDERAECKYFRCPKVIGNGLDLTACSLRIVFRNANKEIDYYLVDGCTDDGDGYVTFCWELRRNVTRYKGIVHFIVCVCNTVDDVIVNEWNTTLASGKVLEGLEPTDHADEEFVPDIIQRLEKFAIDMNAAVQQVEAAAQRAESAAISQPIIKNGTWWIWNQDSGAYEDTSIQTGASTYPSYVVAEANNVARTIMRLPSEHTVTFAVISDAHVNYGDVYAENTQTAVRHAAAAIDIIASQVGVDFMVNLGDNLYGANTNVDDAENEQLILNKIIFDAFRSHPNFRLVGNHDANLYDACIPTSHIYAMNGKYNDFDDTGVTPMRGFGYKDFSGYKLRVIGLNTSDYINDKGGFGMSDEQKVWFMKALDLSDKADGAEWKTLILSHFPLDYPSGDYNTPADVTAILTAYQTGTAVNIDAGSYDYAAKNVAHIIANIHGHVHNFSRGIMSTGILRVSTPNTCFYNNGAAGDGISDYLPNEIYDKIAGTAEDTTVTVYSIDLINKVIYSVNYGAGYDREISYDGTEPKASYSVMHKLTNCTSSNTDAVMVSGSSYTTTIMAATGYTLTGATAMVTMGGVDITVSAYNNGVVNIAEVTGNIVISVSAMPEGSEEPFVHVVSDLSGAVRQALYITNGALDPQSDNARIILASSTDNGHGWTTREGTTVYLIPKPAETTRIKVDVNDANAQQMNIMFVSFADGMYAKASSSGWLDIGEYTLLAGEGDIEYVVVDVKFADSVEWGYDVQSRITVTFLG